MFTDRSISTIITLMLIISYAFLSCNFSSSNTKDINYTNCVVGLLNDEKWTGVTSIRYVGKNKEYISLGFTNGEEKSYNQIIYCNSVSIIENEEQKLQTVHSRTESPRNNTTFTSILPNYKSGDYYVTNEQDDFRDFIKITKFDKETFEVEGIIQASFSRSMGKAKKDNLEDKLVFKSGLFHGKIKNP